ncbi:MAG: hypothetical protein SF123_17595 [Chloroflexota bacterium]|nr:hypothetical protein [Chloroflexota bacterium]
MAIVGPRERLIRKLFDMTDEQIITLESYIESLRSMELPEDYSPETDLLIGFMSGPPDLSVRAKDILHAEFGMPKKD